MTSYVFTKMTYNSTNGTYSYNYTIDKPGIISVYIFSTINNVINATVYTGRSFNETQSETTLTQFNWDVNQAYNSGNFSSYFLSPT